MTSRVLITDFDGTMTAEDFYLLSVRRFLQPEDLQPWDDYQHGRISHFTALQRIYNRIRATEEEVLRMLRDMRPDPRIPQALDALGKDNWQVIVASAGCAWYIQRILNDMGVQLEVHANPGHYLPGGPLRMEAPVHSPFYSAQTGIDKAGIVRFYLRQNAMVAYAGDGQPDLEAALLVPASLRFARSDLADALHKKGEDFRPFTVWSEVADVLLNREQSGQER